MRKFLHWVWSFLEVFIIVYVILITSFILCRNKYGYTQFGNYTFQNIDLIDERNIQNTKKGDLLIVKNSNDIHVGDLIYYYAAYNETYIIRSDYVTKIDSDDYSSLYTVHRGDDDITISSTRLLGKYANTYGTLGSVLQVLESRIGFLFLVLLPIMIVFIYQVYEFIVIIRYEKVEDIEDEEDSSSKQEEVKPVAKESKISTATVEKEETSSSVPEEKVEKNVDKFQFFQEEEPKKEESEEEIEIL